MSRARSLRRGGGLSIRRPNAVIGTYSLNGSPVGGSAITVDSQLRRVFIALSNVIVIYDMDTFLPLGTISFSNPSGGTVTNLVRWGANGLAIRIQNSSSDNFLIPIQSPGVSPSAPIPAGLSLDTSNTSVSEGSATVTVNVLRSGDTTGTSSIDYSTAHGTAVAGSDYVAASGTLTYLPGEISKPVQITVLNDSTFEGNETFSLNISNPSAGAQLLSPSSAVINIIDNDPRPGISIDDATVTEGPMGTISIVNVQVRLSNPSIETVSVQYATSNGTAIAGADYVAANGTLTFAPLETTKTIPITVNGDGVLESGEVFFVNLSAPSNGSMVRSQAAITISDFAPSSKQRADFDGDGKTDLTIYRPDGGYWFSLRSGDGSALIQQWGISGDVVTPGDFDGDGKADVAVYRPDSGLWFILRSSDSTLQLTQWGAPGDIPVAADFDGDGKTDIAIYRPDGGYWFVL
jgi:Calx-beta domain-containing protein/VCBS repeat protein